MERSRIATDIDGLLLGDLKPGARVGDYRIDATLAARGTGVVYAATHMVLPRRAAIKVMPSLHEWSRKLATQLLREACLLEAIDHPGVARVFECGVLADKRPWVASELVEGVTLADITSRNVIENRRMAPLDVAILIRDVSQVLEHVHRRGVVHCNLGAHAIAIGGNHRFAVTLSDWSSARTFDSNTPIPLQPQAPARPHTSPEQREGSIIDGRTDVYALGINAFRAMYGVFPDSGMHPPMTDIPPMLATLVAQMISSNPLDRPTSAKVLNAVEFVISTIERPDDELDQALANIAIGDHTSVIDEGIDDGIAEFAIDDSAAVPLPTAVSPSGKTITSDDVSHAAGEIDVAT